MKASDFYGVVEKRRSIRKFTNEAVPPEVIRRGLQAALLAPNSSNTQTWDFYWVRTGEKKSKLVEACLNQSAARTAQELIVVTADASLWKRSYQPLNEWVERVQAPSVVKLYYSKLIPITYRSGPFGLLGALKWAAYWIYGWFKPIMRMPATWNDLQMIAIKSAALACENFVLSMTAEGFSTCMMEGFDANRVRKILNLKRSSRVVMVIAVGRESDRGTWGPQYRLPDDWVIHEV